MGYFSNLHQNIIELHEDGLSIDEIARQLKVDLVTVAEIVADYDQDLYDDSMDGDFDSAMTSAGMGTDEDYGYYGDE
jgi:orotate phosphoribosyltransferase-like protein